MDSLTDDHQSFSRQLSAESRKRLRSTHGSSGQLAGWTDSDAARRRDEKATTTTGAGKERSEAPDAPFGGRLYYNTQRHQDPRPTQENEKASAPLGTPLGTQRKPAKKMQKRSGPLLPGAGSASAAATQLQEPQHKIETHLVKVAAPRPPAISAKARTDSGRRGGRDGDPVEAIDRRPRRGQPAVEAAEHRQGRRRLGVDMRWDQDDGVRSRALRINSKKEPVNLEDLEANFQQNHRAAQTLFLMEIDLRRQWDVYIDTLSTLAREEASYIEEQYWEQVEFSWEMLTQKWAKKGKAVPARAQPRPPAGVGGVKILQNRMSLLGGIPGDVREKMRQKLDKLAEAFSSDGLSNSIRQVDRDEFAALAEMAEHFFVQDKGRAITLSLSGKHAHGRDSSGGAC
eukprot:g1196.t1